MTFYLKHRHEELGDERWICSIAGLVDKYSTFHRLSAESFDCLSASFLEERGDLFLKGAVFEFIFWDNDRTAREVPLQSMCLQNIRRHRRGFESFNFNAVCIAVDEKSSVLFCDMNDEYFIFESVERLEQRSFVQSTLHMYDFSSLQGSLEAVIFGGGVSRQFL